LKREKKNIKIWYCRSRRWCRDGMGEIDGVGDVGGTECILGLDNEIKQNSKRGKIFKHCRRIHYGITQRYHLLNIFMNKHE